MESSKEIAQLDRSVDGWAKIKPASHYAGVSERTFRGWLKIGLPHSRLPSGTILIRFDTLDKWLQGFSVDESRVDELVGEVLRELKA